MRKAIDLVQEAQRQKSAHSADAVVQRLNVLIALMLDRMDDSHGTSMAAKITKLAALGLAPTDISEIVGKPLNFVTATLSQRNITTKKGKP